STASATTDIYTLSLHDALPIFRPSGSSIQAVAQDHANERLTSLAGGATPSRGHKEAQHTAIDGKPFMRAFLPRTTRGYAPTTMRDRKSTRLNSSHVKISYAVFC